MSKVADSIRCGLEQAVAYAKGEVDRNTCRVHVPKRIDVRAIRTRLSMTQEEFAGRFGFSVNTLRHREQGKRQPEGATHAYLLVIDRAPCGAGGATGGVGFESIGDSSRLRPHFFPASFTIHSSLTTF